MADGIAHRALVIWGLCYQLRDPESKEAPKSARLEYSRQHLARERDAMIEAFSKYQQGPKGKPQLTPAAQDRIRRIRDAFRADIEHEKGCGFGVGPGRVDFYPRPGSQVGAFDKYPKGPNPNRIDSVQAVTFLIVDTYLAKRPMQRALAWRVYVERKSVRGFRYSEGQGDSQVTFCGSERAATRVMTNLRTRLGQTFEASFIEMRQEIQEFFEPKKAS